MHLHRLASTAPVALLLGTLALASGVAEAVDKDGNYAVWGSGAKSCHAYNQSPGDDGRLPYRNYVMGYLTAYNALSEETYAISGDMSLDAVMTWLDEYCGQKPMHSFEQALIDFTSSHVEDRFRNPPGRGAR